MTTPEAAAGLTMWARIGESAARNGTHPMAEPSDNALQRSKVIGAASRSHAMLEHPADAARVIDGVMDRYAQGDDLAFGDLYRLAAPRVRGFLLRLSGDLALADDLAQEAFLRVHRARGTFAAGAAALPWLFTIARNVMRDHARRAKARPSPRSVAAGASREDDGPEQEASPDARGDEVLAAREMAATVRQALETMPAIQREAFVLIRFEGLSVSEAAQVLGATESAVKVRAFRAYEALRAALTQEGGLSR